MSAGKVFYFLLSTDAGISALVGTNIYPDAAPQGTANPCIIYQDTTSAPTNTKDGSSTLDVFRFQLDCYAGSRKAAGELNEAIRTALDRQSGTIQSVEVDKIIYESESAFYDPESVSFRVMSDYRIRIKR